MTEEPPIEKPKELEEPKPQPSPLPESEPPKKPDVTMPQPEVQHSEKESQGSMSTTAPKEPKNMKKEEKPTSDTVKQSSSSKSISATAVAQSQHQAPLTFISPRDRLFGLSSEVHSFSTGLLEKTSDGILKAAKIGDFAALKEHHEKGYSLLSIDASGQTALHLAARYGHKDIIRYLIACAPASILNMVDNDKGQTALHKAAQYKRRSICCMLVAGGATLTVKDRHGNTPRDLALQAEDRDLAAYLYSQEQFQLTTEEMENAL